MCPNCWLLRELGHDCAVVAIVAVAWDRRSDGVVVVAGLLEEEV